MQLFLSWLSKILFPVPKKNPKQPKTPKQPTSQPANKKEYLGNISERAILDSTAVNRWPLSWWDRDSHWQESSCFFSFTFSRRKKKLWCRNQALRGKAILKFYLSNATLPVFVIESWTTMLTFSSYIIWIGFFKCLEKQIMCNFLVSQIVTLLGN